MSSDYTGDLNDLTTCCMVRCANTCLHNPIDGYIILEVIGENNGSEGNLIQRASDYLGRDKGIYERVKGDNGAWGDWIRIDNFGCSTPSALASLLGGYLHIMSDNFVSSSTAYKDYSVGYGIAILRNSAIGSVDMFIFGSDDNSVTRLTNGNTQFSLTKQSEFVTRITGNGNDRVFVTFVYCEF